LWAGGQQANPREHTQVCDRGERAQPTHPQLKIWRKKSQHPAG